MLAGIPFRVGALVVSTTLVLVVFALARVAGVPLAHFDQSPLALRRALLVGGVGVAGVQALAHLLAVAVLTATGQQATILVSPVNPVTKSAALGGVAVYLLFGVVLTAVGQELLFRSLLLGALRRHYSFWRANLSQGALFGAWHLTWPLALYAGEATPPVPLVLYAGGFVIITGLIGTVYGVFVRATGTVWSSTAAHLLHNLTAVFLHVRTASGADRGSALAASLVAGYAGLAWIAWIRWEQ